MAAAKRDDRRRNSQYTPSEEPSEYTRLKWRVESTPSDRRRQRLHYRKWDRQLREELSRSPPREELSQSAHTSELQGRHQDGSPMEELDQSAPNTVPFGTLTREELQLRQSVSSEEL